MTKRSDHDQAQPDLHMAGWPEIRLYGRAETDGFVLYWWEERMRDGSIKRHPLQPYRPVADSPNR